LNGYGWNARPVNSEDFGGTGKEVVNQSPEIAAELKQISRQ
jgi:hypothetical protein